VEVEGFEGVGPGLTGLIRPWKYVEKSDARDAPQKTSRLERVKKLVFETKLAAGKCTSARSSAILSPALISVPPR
jgi:hypothetical protein